MRLPRTGEEDSVQGQCLRPSYHLGAKGRVGGDAAECYSQRPRGWWKCGVALCWLGELRQRIIHHRNSNCICYWLLSVCTPLLRFSRLVSSLRCPVLSSWMWIGTQIVSPWYLYNRRTDTPRFTHSRSGLKQSKSYFEKALSPNLQLINIWGNSKRETPSCGFFFLLQGFCV